MNSYKLLEFGEKISMICVDHLNSMDEIGLIYSDQILRPISNSILPL